MEPKTPEPDWAAVLAERTLERVQADRARWRAHATRARAMARRLAERLADEPGVRRVVLFGSLAGAGGLVHEGSDIDLAVEGLAPERLFAAGAALEALAELPVDLVRMEDAPESLRARIRAEGEVLHVAG